jgi:uncharacterized membrane protein
MMVLSTLGIVAVISTNVAATQLGPADLSISVVGDSKKFAKPGEWVSFNLRVTNSNSNNDGWVNLTLSGGTTHPDTGKNWRSILEKQSNIVVRYSSSTDVRLDVRVGAETFNSSSEAGHVERVVINGQYYDKGDQTYAVAGTLYQTVDVQVRQKHQFNFKNKAGEPDPKKPNTARQVQFNFTVNNTGNGEDTFTFKVENAPGTPFIATTVIQAYSGKDVTLFINNIPKSTEAGIHFVTVKATSSNTSIAERQAGVNVEIDPTYNLDLSTTEPTTKNVKPDKIAYYNFTIENKGNDEDEVLITSGFISSAPNWEVDVTYPSSPHTIPRNSSSTLSLQISPPANATYPKTVNVFLNVSSKNDPTVYQYINTIKAKILQESDVDMVPIYSQRSINSTYQASFPIDVYNYGNGQDIFELSLIGNFPSGELWNYDFNPPSVTLSPEGTTNDHRRVYFNVTGPEDAQYGSFIMKAKATSKKDLKIFDQHNLTISVGKFYNIDITRLASEKQPGYPGAEIVIKIKGENTGNFQDTFNMDVDVPPNALDWITDFEPDIFEDLAPGKIENTTFTLNVDDDAPEGFYIFTVSCYSTQDETRGDSFKLNVSISHQTYDVELYLGTSEVYPKPGSSESFNITITNKGNGEDSFGIKIPTVPIGWTVRPSTPNTQRLKQDQEETVMITVTVPSNEKQTTENITINVSSRGEPTVYTYEIVSVKVDLIRAVRFVKTDKQKEGEPGGYVEFEVELENRGTVEDTYTLEVGDVDEFVDFSLPPELTIQPNNKKKAILNVSISDANVEDLPPQTNLTVTVTSKNASEVNAERTYTIDITAVRGVRISPSPSWQKGQPKDKLIYNITVENTGTGDDRFSLAILSNPPYSGWARILNFGDYTETLAPGGITYVDVEVEIPANQEPAEGKIFLKAESKDNPEKTHTINFTFSIEQIFKVQVTVEPTTKTVNPGENASYVVRVKNTGTGLDNVSIEYTVVSDIESVSAGVFSFDYLTLTPGQTKTLTFIVTAVKEPEEGKLAPQIDIEVTSEEDIDDPAASDTERITMEINPTVDIELQADKLKKDIIPNLSGTKAEIEYTVTVWNRGLDEDQFDIVESNDHGYIVEVDPTTTPKIDSGDSATVIVKIIIDNKAQMTTTDYSTTITVTSRTNEEKSEQIILRTRVKQAYGVELQPVDTRLETDDTLNGDYRIVNFLVEVENIGTGEDTFKLEFDGEYSHWATLSETSYLSLMSKQKDTMTVTVKVPRETEIGDIQIDFKATSRGDDTLYEENNDATDVVTLTVEVTQFYEVSLTTSESNTKSGLPGDLIDFTFTVSNRGNGDDKITMEKKDYDLNWDWILSSITFNLAGTGDATGGDTKEITLSIDIPTDKYGESGSYSISIVVSSLDTPDGKIKHNENIPLVFTVKVDEQYEVDMELDYPTSVSQEKEDPGRSIDYQATVRNKGNTVDTFNIDVSGTKSDWVVLEANSITIGPFKSRKINFTVEIPDLSEVEPSDVEAQKYTINIKATSEGDQDQSAEIDIHPTVDSEYEVTLDYSELDINSANEGLVTVDPNGDPGYEKFTLYVTNDGNALDTVTFTSTVPDDWSVDFDNVQTKTLNVEVGVTKQVSVKITPPEDAKDGESRKITITVKSKDQKTKSIFYIRATVETAVIKLTDLKISGDKTEGSKVTISVMVKNDGNVDAEDIRIKFTDNKETIKEETINELTAGSSRKLSFNYELESGDHEIEVETVDEWSGSTQEAKESFSAGSELLPGNWLYIIMAIVIVVVFIIGIIIASVHYSRGIPDDLKEEIAMAKQAARMGKSPEEISDMRKKRMEKSYGMETRRKPSLTMEKETPVDEEAEKPKSTAGASKPTRIKCPKCDKIQTVPSTKRPIEFGCSSCGMKLVLKK